MEASCLSRVKGSRDGFDDPPISHAGVIKLTLEVNFILEQALYVQRGEYRYSSTLSSTSALDEDRWLKPPPPDALSPRKKTRYQL
jgi:hypothetical protein